MKSKLYILLFRGIPLLLLIGVAFQLSSCVSVPSYTGARTELDSFPPAYHHEMPRFWITYFPAFSKETNPALSSVPEGRQPSLLADVSPLRNHAGLWTDDAMRYDLDSMQAANIEAAILMLRPQDLIDARKLQRIKRFFTLSYARRPRFRVGLGIYADKPLALGSGNFARFLQQSGFANLKGALSRSVNHPRLLVLFDTDSIKLHQQHFPDESAFDLLSLQRFEDATHVFLRGGNSGFLHRIDWTTQESWPQPRGNGSFFSQHLREAFKAGKRIICIHSWNDMQDGSFLVPNNFDRDLLLITLYEEREKLEQLRIRDSQNN